MSASPVRVVIRPDTSQLVPLFERIAAFLEEYGAAIEHWSRHHPPPLSIDGNAYRQRRRARARRNR